MNKKDNQNTSIHQNPLLRMFLLILCMALIITTPACTGTEKADAPKATHSESRPIDSTLALETFDTAWTLINEGHFDPNFNGVDWPAVRDELRPQAEKATTFNEVRSIISDMIHRLNQSHFALIPGDVIDKANEPQAEPVSNQTDIPATENPSTASKNTTNKHDHPATDSEPSLGDGDPGLDVRLLNKQVIVLDVRPDSPADAAGVKSGWLVNKIDGFEPEPMLDQLLTGNEDDKYINFQAWSIINSKFTGPIEKPVTTHFLDANDKPITIDLNREAPPGINIQMGNLPSMNVHLTSNFLDTDKSYGAKIGYIKFNVWMVHIAQPFAKAVDNFRDADGIIIDLRGNPGGLGGMVMGVGGHFFEENVSFGTMKTRNDSIEFKVNPQRSTVDGKRVDPYAGPVAVIIDGYSASTSELFAAGIQAQGRARIFGESSAGMALPAHATRLPNGDVLLHAFADYIPPEGTVSRPEGAGVIPDETVPQSRKDLLEGRDAPLDMATHWIINQR